MTRPLALCLLAVLVLGGCNQGFRTEAEAQRALDKYLAETKAWRAAAVTTRIPQCAIYTPGLQIKDMVMIVAQDKCNPDTLQVIASNDSLYVFILGED